MQASGVFVHQTLFCTPSAGDVASPPFWGGVIAQVGHSAHHQQAAWHPLLSGEGSYPKYLSICSLPLISRDTCLRSVLALSSSPDLISLLDSLSALRHPYVCPLFLASYVLEIFQV